MTGVMAAWGVLVTLFDLFLGGAFFSAFVPGETRIIGMGMSYLRIFAFCQLAACLEGVGASVFRGCGSTWISALINIAAHLVRISLAYILSAGSMGVNGIWVALTASSFLRGMGIWLAGIWYAKRRLFGGMNYRRHGRM
jgi:Na+-driven multidrug efflux pump